MPTKKHRIVENLILITFPLVLFAGCAGSDVKPDIGELDQESVVSELQTTDYNQNLINERIINETDSLPVSGVQSEIREEATEESTLQVTATSEENELTPETKQTNVSVISMPEKRIFFFDTNMHNLSDRQREELTVHAEYLKANPDAVLLINGHADERGTENYNQTLSEKRAQETYQLLVNSGVPQDQLVTKAFGELVPMHSENNWDENRRVELEYTDPMMLSSM